MATDYAPDFADFGGVTYLNSAFQGPMPLVAAAAAEEALQLKKTPNLLLDEDYFSYLDGYRKAVANLIGCDETDVAVTDSATHGVMLLVNGLDWQPGDEVILPQGEFPANRFPWLSLERQYSNALERSADLFPSSFSRPGRKFGGMTFRRLSAIIRSTTTVNARNEQMMMGTIMGPPLTTKPHTDCTFIAAAASPAAPSGDACAKRDVHHKVKT